MIDVRNCRIQVFTPEGKFLRQWGKRESSEGEFEAPRGITTVAVHLPGRDAEIVVTDHYSGRIQMFTPQGKFLRQWKEENWDYPRPEETTSLPGGEIAIVDSRNCCVQVFGFALV